VLDERIVVVTLKNRKTPAVALVPKLVRKRAIRYLLKGVWKVLLALLGPNDG
jgi:hypothetical protein